MHLGRTAGVVKGGQTVQCQRVGAQWRTPLSNPPHSIPAARGSTHCGVRTATLLVPPCCQPPPPTPTTARPCTFFPRAPAQPATPGCVHSSRPAHPTLSPTAKPLPPSPPPQGARGGQRSAPAHLLPRAPAQPAVWAGQLCGAPCHRRGGVTAHKPPGACQGGVQCGTLAQHSNHNRRAMWSRAVPRTWHPATAALCSDAQTGTHPS